MVVDLENLRQEYRSSPLDIEDVDKNPLQQFKKWFAEVLDVGLLEPNAMILSTATPDGKPSARTVLLKGLADDGFAFYTNYNSRKGKEIEENPFACLVFLWLELQRQVRIEGIIEREESAKSTAYFQNRPRGSQIGAWASPQSDVIENRSVLEEAVRHWEAKYAEVENLPRPAHWGGYVLKANRLEFWQGRENRLHDRIQYSLQEDGSWKIERLAP